VGCVGTGCFSRFLAGPPEEPIVYFKGMEEVAADEQDDMTTTPT
jgi:hypothetical protein